MQDSPLQSQSHLFSFSTSRAANTKSSVTTVSNCSRNALKEAKRKKILVVGLGDTGKSSIILKFLYGFPDARNYGPEESYFTSIKYEIASLLSNTN